MICFITNQKKDIKELKKLEFLNPSNPMNFWYVWINYMKYSYVGTYWFILNMIQLLPLLVQSDAGKNSLN